MKSNSVPVSGETGTGRGGAGTAPGGAALRPGLGGNGGQRLPVAPRERKPALAALAVLLILGGALTSAYLVTASGQRVSAIRIAEPVAAGQRIPASALEEVRVGDTGEGYFIAWSERAKVTRAFAAVPLVKGALLSNQMVAAQDDAARGRVVVGLAVKPGQYPSADLTTGRHVGLYAVTGGNQGASGRAGTLLSGDAIVVAVRADGEEGVRAPGDATTLDVAVPPNEAAQVAQAAAAGAVAVVLLPEGTRLSKGGTEPPPVRESPETPTSPRQPQTPGGN